MKTLSVATLTSTLLFTLAISIAACSSEEEESAPPQEQEDQSAAQPAAPEPPEQAALATPSSSTEEPRPDPTAALNALKALSPEASPDETAELMRRAIGDAGQCEGCVEVIIKIGREQQRSRVREEAIRTLARSKVRSEDICAFWLEAAQQRQGHNSSTSCAAFDMFVQSGDMCAAQLDAVVTEIEGRFAAHDQYGALTGAHVLYVKRFIEENEHLSSAQRARIITAARTLASQAREGSNTQQLANEIAALSAER